MANDEKSPDPDKDLENPEDPDDEEPPEDAILDFAQLADEAEEEEVFDLTKYYEDVILTHADYEPMTMEDLIPDDIMDAPDGIKELEDAVFEHERRTISELHDHQPVEDVPEVEMEEMDIGKDIDLSTDAPKKYVVRIPSGIIGRIFTIRRKGWKDRIWEVTPGGAKSGKTMRSMTKPLIQAIVKSDGFVILSSKDYEVMASTEDEKGLIDSWRSARNEEENKRKITQDIVASELSDMMVGGEDLGSEKEPEKVHPGLININIVIKNLPEYIIKYGNKRIPDQNPESFKVLGMMCLSTILDGKFVIRDGWKDEIYPNLYVIIIGPPSTQKSSSFTILKPIIKKVVPDAIYKEDWTKEALGVGFKENRSGIAWKDEFAQIIDPEIREGYQKGVLEFLTMTYDEHEYRALRLSREDVDVSGVNMCFAATIQTERFYRLVTEDDVNTGFFNRFCYVILQDRKGPPNQTRYEKEIAIYKNTIITALQEVRRKVDSIDRDNPVMYSYSDGALDILNKWYKDVDKECRSFTGLRAMSLIAISSRIFTMAKKAAIIYETLDRISERERLYRNVSDELPSYDISQENMQKGIDFANMCFTNSKYLYTRLRSTDVLVKLERFMDVIKSSRAGAITFIPKGNTFPVHMMRRSEVIRYVGMKLKDFNDYLSTFLAMDRLFLWENVLVPGKSGKTNTSTFICTKPPPKKGDARYTEWISSIEAYEEAARKARVK